MIYRIIAVKLQFEYFTFTMGRRTYARLEPQQDLKNESASPIGSCVTRLSDLIPISISITTSEYTREATTASLSKMSISRFYPLPSIRNYFTNLLSMLCTCNGLCHIETQASLNKLICLCYGVALDSL